MRTKFRTKHHVVPEETSLYTPPADAQTHVHTHAHTHVYTYTHIARGTIGKRRLEVSQELAICHP